MGQRNSSADTNGESHPRSPQARYCLIGAGFSGLGVAKAFQDAGIEFDCFEKNSDVGGNWLNGVYDSTHIISSRDSTCFEDFPMPRDYPDFPSARQILEYLRSYADAYGLRDHIRFNTEVVWARPLSPDGMNGWEVQLSNGQTLRYAGVVVANGHHWSKRTPQYPGTFTGEILHSKDYRNSADFKGKRVLVVGAGNSGCDIAVEAALAGLQSAISMRRGYYFLPKTIFGLPTAELDQWWLPVAAQKTVLKTFLRLTQGANSKYGLQVPDHDLFDHHPIVNSQLLYFIRHGRVQPKPDIESFDGRLVKFVDGTLAEFDTIVYSTGFNVEFPFLDPKYFDWERGIPKRVAGMLAPRLAGLYVFGLAQPRGGAGPLITLGARLLVDMIDTQRKLDAPLAVELEKLEPASARMLFGVAETKRRIRLGHVVLSGVRIRAALRRGRNFDFNPPRTAGSRPRPRNLKFPFSTAGVPRHWLMESMLATHLVNGLNLVFPDGERFFIRTVRRFADQITDPELRERVNLFIAQEVQHGREHERYFEVMREQGYEIEPYLKLYRKVAYDWIEAVSPLKLRLAATAALEHFTAAFAEQAIRRPYLREHSHPVMSDLYLWHAAEELEHKSVAYDVLQGMAPGYGLRMAGLMVATATLGGFWLLGVGHLLQQEPEFRWRRLPGMLRVLRQTGFTNSFLGKAFLEYMRPGFHPGWCRNDALADRVIADLEARHALPGSLSA